jgi:4-oxalocrotonate tautomerase
MSAAHPDASTSPDALTDGAGQPGTPRSLASAYERNGTHMPLINVKVIEGVFDAAQKQDIIEKLTDTMVGIEGENLRPVTWVVVEEVRSGQWGVGGEGLTTEAVKTLAGRSSHV